MIGDSAPGFTLYDDSNNAWTLSGHRGMELDRISRRAAFVIDPEGMIAYAEVRDSTGDQPNFDAVKDALGAEVG